MTNYDCLWYKECSLTCDCNKMVPCGKLQKGVRGCFTSCISSKVELQETEQDIVEYGHVVSKFREESKDFEKKRFECLDPGTWRNWLRRRIWKLTWTWRKATLPVRQVHAASRTSSTRLGNALHSRQAKGAVRLNTMRLFCVQMRAFATFSATMRQPCGD